MKTNLMGLSIWGGGLAAATLALGAGSLQAADITGKITLKGTPPPEITIDPSADPVCAQLHTTTFTTRHYVVGADGGLGDVFVYIKEGASGKTYPTRKEKPVLDQEGCFYKPYVLGVMVNEPFAIKNSDPTLHNIHALPKANAPFNFAQPLKDSVTERKFDKPEVFVKFKCDVHPWMFAYMGVVDNPFFAVTGKDGAFKIPNLPPGKYTLAAVHPKLGEQTKEITVVEGANTAIDFTFALKSGS